MPLHPLRQLVVSAITIAPLVLTACGGGDKGKADGEAGSAAAEKKAPTDDQLRDQAKALFGTLPAEVSNENNPVTDEKVALGRMLYHDARLSKNHDVSCQTCHKLEAFGVDGTAAWFDNIVLAGGSTMFAGLPERLEAELQLRTPGAKRPKIAARRERKHAAWVGASMLGSLSVMSQMWVSKEEYDETGPLIVNRKCF